MGLDMSFYHTDKPIHLNKVNRGEEEFDADEIFYFRKFWSLHTKIFEIYQEFNGEIEDGDDNGLYILLEEKLLERLEQWLYDYLHSDEEIEYIAPVEEFYKVLCSMIYRTRHGEYFYYNGDYQQLTN